jgi:hypothetical protein
MSIIVKIIIGQAFGRSFDFPGFLNHQKNVEIVIWGPLL